MVSLALLTLLAGVPAAALFTQAGLRTLIALTNFAARGVVQIEDGSGTLADVAILRGFSYHDGVTTVRIDEVAVRLRLSRLWIARVQAESLDIGRLEVHVRDVPSGDTTPLSVLTPVYLAVESGRVARFALDVEPDLNWTYEDVILRARWPRRRIQVTALEATTAEAGRVRLAGALTVQDDRLHLDTVTLTGPGVVQLDGAVALTLQAQNDISGRWSALRPPADWDAQGVSSPAGTLSLQGPWPDHAWASEGSLVHRDLVFDFKGEGRGGLDGLQVSRLQVNGLDGRGRAKGRVDWTPALRVVADATFDDLDPARWQDDWPGRLNGDLQAEIRWHAERPDVRFYTTLRDSELRGYPLALRAQGTTEGRQVRLDDFVLASGGSRIRGRGALWPRLDLAYALDSPDLATLWPGLAGAAKLAGVARGDPRSPEVTFDGTVDEFAVADVRAGHILVDGRWNDASDSRLRVESTDVAVGGQPLDTLTLRAAGTRAAHRIEVEGVGAPGGFELATLGAWRSGQWQGRLIELQVDPAGQPSWTLEQAAEWLTTPAAALQLARTCLRSAQGRVCVAATVDADHQEVSLSSEELPLSSFAPWLPEDWRLDGAMSGTGRVVLRDGDPWSLAADLRAGPGRVSAGGAALDFGEGSLVLKPTDAGTTGHLALFPGDGEVRGEFRLSGPGALLDRDLRGTWKASMPDLSWLPLLSPEIAASRGALHADLTLSGTPRQPSLRGQLAITDGELQLTTPGTTLTDFTASFERRRDAPLALQVTAKSGGGTLVLDGTLAQWRPMPVGTLHLGGEAAQFLNTPQARAWVTPDLELRFEGRDAKLSGAIEVVRADITPSELESAGVGPSTDQVILHDGEPAGAGAIRLTSDVRIRLGDEVRFDGLGLTTRLAGAVRAVDEPGRPTRATGELRLEGGRYQAYGQDLQIDTGRLIFAGGPLDDPAIDLQASRSPREDIRVVLRARGSLDAPTFSLSSVPAMTQEEQLSWLVLGRSLSETLQSGGQGELTSAAASLGLLGGDYLAQRVGSQLGVDEVTVGARPGETADQARFTIGKYLSPKLYVSYGVGLFQPGQYFNLQYDLGRGFKLSGESGVAQGGDLLYSIER